MITLNYPLLLFTIALGVLVAVFSPSLITSIGVKGVAILNSAVLALPGLVVIYAYFTGMLIKGLMDPILYSHPSVGSFTLVIDGLNAPIILGVSIVTFTVALYSIR